jgi:hypothetical protein
MGWNDEVQVEALVGQEFATVTNRENEEVLFSRADGTGFKMYHQ